MDYVPALIGALGGLGAGAAYTFVRKMGLQGEEGARIVFYFSLFSCVVTLPMFLLGGAAMAPWQFFCLLAAGLTAMIAIQAFINIGVVVGVMPTTGLPLPFFSAGGTSISMLMAAVGILLSVSRSTAK